MTPFEGWSNWETNHYQLSWTDYEFWQEQYLEGYSDMYPYELGQVMKEYDFEVLVLATDRLLELPMGQLLSQVIGTFIDAVNYTEIAREVIKHANESQLD